MAEQAILTVSLKDYKKQIDDLRASLLNLESTSEEYQRIAEQIKDRQEKLNEVMGVGKKDVDAVAGSYNALSNQLAKMKKEWKNMKIGTDEWVALGEQINNVNTQLKDADETVGVFSRNVGNYENAFKSAFSSILPSLNQISPNLGEIASMTLKLIPVINAVSSTAIAGINGVKAALIKSGIGALVVAVGWGISKIVEYWDDIVEYFTGPDPVEERYNKERAALDKLLEKHEEYIKIMGAMGASAMEIAIANAKFYNEQLVKEWKTLIGLVEGTEKYKEQKKKVKEIEDKVNESLQEEWRLVQGLIAEEERLNKMSGFTEQEKALEAINKKFDDAIATIKNYGEEFLKLKQRQDGFINSPYWEKWGEFIDGYVEKLEKLKQAAIDRYYSDLAKEKWKEEERTISSLTETVINSFKTRRQAIEDTYKKEKKLMEKHHKDTTALTKKYLNDIAASEREANNIINSALSSLAKVSSSFTMDSLTVSKANAEKTLKDFADIVRKFNNYEGDIPPEAPLSNTIELINSGISQMAFEIGLIKTNTVEEFAIAWQAAAANVRIANLNLEQYSAVYEAIVSRIERDKKALELVPTEEVGTVSPRRVMEIFQLEEQLKEVELTLSYYAMIERKAFDEGNEIARQEYEKIKDSYVKIYNIKTSLVKRLSELSQEQYEAERAVYDRAAEDANSDGDLWGIWSQKSFNESFEKRIEAEKFALDYVSAMTFESASAREEFEREHQQALLDIQKEYNQAKIQNYQDLATGIDSIFGSIADMYAEDINAQVDSGKKSKAQAEKDYKRVQSIKIATATIDTLQGALAAFMGYQELGQPWGGILGGIQAAAVTAAGIAQIQKIKNTNPYTNSTPDSSAYAAANPQMREFSPDYFSNITGASDVQRLANAITETPIKAYVTESDITSAQELAKQREEEATF